MPRIVQLTDLHLTPTPRARSWGADVWTNFRRALAYVATDLGTVDRLVLTGDLANRGDAETYARLREALHDWLDRVHLVPGNHDDRERVRAAFGDRALPRLDSVNFSVRCGAFQLVGLDTLRPWRVHGRVGEGQLAWLDGQLRALAADAPLLLFQHHPPIRVGTWWLDKDWLRDHERLRELTRDPRVRGLFCGHVHQEAEGRFDVTPVWTTPSTAYQFPPRSLLPRSLKTGPALRVIDLDGDRLDTHVVRL